MILAGLMVFSCIEAVYTRADQDDVTSGQYDTPNGQYDATNGQYDDVQQDVYYIGNDEYFQYWQQVAADPQGFDDYDLYEVNAQTEANSNGVPEDKQNGSSPERVSYEIIDSDNFNNIVIPSTIPVTQEPEDRPRGPVNPDNDPTPTEDPRGHANPDNDPTPTEDPRGHANPEVSPTAEPTPAATETPSPVPVEPSPVATATPTPIPVVTAMPTPIVTQVFIPAAPITPIPVVAEEKTPSSVVYDIGLEVGRYAVIKPAYTINESKKSSNTKIILDPRDSVGSFDVEYESRAMAPGDATLTFFNKQNNFSEIWNVHVYCRPLDFDQTEYVVQKKGKSAQYLTLNMKYFEYSFEYAYDFQWSSSNKDVAYMAGADSFSTFGRICIVKSGVTVITVKDKYGNSASAVVIVKPEETPKPTATPIPTATPTPKPTATTAPTSSPEPDKTDTKALSNKQTKAIVKASTIEAKVSKNVAGKITLKWTPKISDSRVKLDGYVIQISADKGKTYTDLKTLKSTKLKYNYTKGKKNKTYYFRIRGYKVIKGKTVYTKNSNILTAKFTK